MPVDSQDSVVAADVEFAIFQNDGPGGAPGTLIWTSGLTAVEVFSDQFVLDVAVPNVQVPDAITITSWIPEAEQVALGRFHSGAPSIGTFQTAWLESEPGVWVPGFDFAVRVFATEISEPSALYLLVAALILCTLCRFPRTVAPNHGSRGTTTPVTSWWNATTTAPRPGVARRRGALFVALAAIAFGAAPTAAEAVIVPCVWLSAPPPGGVAGNWTNVVRWSCAAIPDNSGQTTYSVTIDDNRTRESRVTMDDADRTIERLEIRPNDVGVNGDRLVVSGRRLSIQPPQPDPAPAPPRVVNGGVIAVQSTPQNPNSFINLNNVLVENFVVVPGGPGVPPRTVLGEIQATATAQVQLFNSAIRGGRLSGNGVFAIVGAFDVLDGSVDQGLTIGGGTNVRWSSASPTTLELRGQIVNNGSIGMTGGQAPAHPISMIIGGGDLNLSGSGRLALSGKGVVGAAQAGNSLVNNGNTIDISGTFTGGNPDLEINVPVINRVGRIDVRPGGARIGNVTNGGGGAPAVVELHDNARLIGGQRYQNEAMGTTILRNGSQLQFDRVSLDRGARMIAATATVTTVSGNTFVNDGELVLGVPENEALISQLTVESGYEQEPGGVLSIDIFNESILDQVIVDGIAELDAGTSFRFTFLDPAVEWENETFFFMTASEFLPGIENTACGNYYARCLFEGLNVLDAEFVIRTSALIRGASELGLRVTKVPEPPTSSLLIAAIAFLMLIRFRDFPTLLVPAFLGSLLHKLFHRGFRVWSIGRHPNYLRAGHRSDKTQKGVTLLFTPGSPARRYVMTRQE